MFQFPTSTYNNALLKSSNSINKPDKYDKDHLQFNSQGVVLIIDVRGFTPHEITIKVSKQILEVVAENNKYGRCGIYRKYSMPYNVQAQGCITQIENGLLYVTIPWENNSMVNFS